MRWPNESSIPLQFWEMEGCGPTGSNPGRVKPITDKIDICHFLARHSVLLGKGKDWLAQDRDNVPAWEIR